MGENIRHLAHDVPIKSATLEEDCGLFIRGPQKKGAASKT
jgi:hypothetical protein